MQTEPSINPVLLYDPSGLYGNIIAENLPSLTTRVLVSPKPSIKSPNLFYIPLKRNIPTLPACIYSNHFIFYDKQSNILPLLPFFLQKKRQDNARIYLFIPIREISIQLLETIRNLSSEVIVVGIGDFFGTLSNWENPLTELIEQASHGTLHLTSSGLSKLYPVYDRDAISVFTDLAFGRLSLQPPTIHVISQQPVTTLSLARQLHKKEPLIAIRLSSTHSSIKDAVNLPFSFLCKSFNYGEKLPHIVLSIESSKKQKKEKAQVNKPYNYLYAVMASVCVGFFITLIVPLVSALVGAEYLTRAYHNVEKGDFQKAYTSASTAKTLFSFAGKTMASIEMFENLGFQKGLVIFKKSVVTGKEVSESFLVGIDGIQLLRNVFSKKSIEPRQDFLTGLRYVRESMTQLTSLQAEDKIPEKYKSKFAALQITQDLFTGTFDVLPEVLGMQEKKTYLLLFQNNMELRPGGGFVGSYGILELDQAKITNFTIHDVYDADGQLKEHIEPPFQLKKYMGANHWFLRDSNFDVDFPKSAAAAALFLKLETGEVVDGVIAIDTLFIKNLLSEIGPLYIQEYKETVTADNFFLLTQKYVQEEFFPGSTQKKDFLQAVYTTLSLKLLDSDRTPYIEIADAIVKSVAQKNILFAFPDKDIQKVFTWNNLSSTLIDTREKEDGYIYDFFGINEANIGANKVNYYLDRAINHSVALMESGVASENVVIEYYNKSTAADAFGGDYKTYVRFILPLAADLQAVTIDGIQQSLLPAVTDVSLIPDDLVILPNEVEVEKSEQEGKKIYGFYTTVPMGAKKTIKISYDFPVNIGQASNTYSLQVFKQPGTNADPYVFSLQTPENYDIRSDNPRVNIQNKKATYFSDLSEDREINVMIVKK